MTKIICPNCNKEGEYEDGGWAYNGSMTGDKCKHCGDRFMFIIKFVPIKRETIVDSVRLNKILYELSQPR